MNTSTIYRPIIRTATITAFAAILGCGQGEDESASNATDAPTASDVTQQAEKAVDTATEFAQSQVDSFKSDMQTRIDGVEERLRELREQAARLPEDARIGLNATIDQLNTQKNDLQERINELGNTSETAWEDVKNGVSQAWDDLDEAVNSAADRFTDG